MSTQQKVLVVDDDRDILEALEIMLSMENFQVQTTPKGEEVFEKVDSFQPHIIILDVLLSGQDGRHICRDLKMNNETKKIPVIMVSAHPNAESSVKEVGANAFLAKPFEVDDLIKKIQELVH